MPDSDSHCLTIKELSDYSVGKLSIEQNREIEKHLEGCSKCKSALSRVDDSEDELVSSLRSAPESKATEFEIEAIAQNVADQTQVGEAPTESVIRGHRLENRQLGRYELHNLIGRGGMGSVLRATHTELDKEVAVKVLSQDQMRNEAAVARFRREMKLLGKLNHPNIVNASDAGFEEGVCFLAMELIDGFDLSKVVAQHGPMRVADACEVVRQVAVGLQHAHEHGLVHRDMKPANVMLTRDGRVKVMDLGLARLSQGGDEQTPATDGLTMSGQIMGTVDYMSPEQVVDSHDVDIRTDIYSTGATLYRLLTGRLPFGDDRFDSVLSKLSALANQDAPKISSFRADIPKPLEKIVHRCIAKKPEDRFATPGNLAKALEPFCQGHNLAKLIHSADQNSEVAIDAALQQTLAPGGGDTIVASEATSVFGSSSTPKWILGLVAAVIAVFGLMYSGVFNAPTPNPLANDLEHIPGATVEATTEPASTDTSNKLPSPNSVTVPSVANPQDAAIPDETTTGKLHVVSIDGADETLTWDEAMKQAEPGDRVSLTPHAVQVYPDLEVDVEGLQILGNCSVLNRVIVSADNVTIDSVEAVCVRASDEPKGLTVRNSRLSYFRSKPGTESTLDNSVMNYYGGGGKVVAKHCTFTAVDAPFTENYSTMLIDPFSDLAFENCIVVGSDSIFRFMSDDKQPNRVAMDNCLVYGNRRQEFDVAPYSEVWNYEQVNARLFSDATELGIDLKDCIVDQSPDFQSTGEKRRYNSFMLQPGSPAIGAASDKQNLGAIADKYDWPLTSLQNNVRMARQMDDRLRAIGFSARPSRTFRIRHTDAANQWADAMADAIPGDRIAFEPTEKEFEGSYLVSVPNVTILGNYQKIDKFVVAVGGVTIDSAQLERIQIPVLHAAIRNVRIRNCRTNGFYAAVRSQVTLENCVANFGGGGGDITANHCTFVRVNHFGDITFRVAPFSDIKMRDCILVSSDRAMMDYMPSDEDPPIQLENCLLFGRQGTEISYKDFDGTWNYDGASLIDFDRFGPDRFQFRDCLLGKAPNFVNYQETYSTDFSLNAGSPAKAAASDNLDIGAIEDPNFDAWPLRACSAPRYSKAKFSEQLRDLPFESQPVIPRISQREWWVTETKSIPSASDRLAAVKSKLAEVNPGFGSGKFEPTIPDGQVTGLVIDDSAVVTLWPLQALANLNSIACTNCKFENLSDITQLPITLLDVRSTLVHDLEPLRGTKLSTLHISHCPIRDLNPIKNCPITTLTMGQTKVADLSPLRGKSFYVLSCSGTPLSGPAALEGIRGKSLHMTVPIFDERWTEESLNGFANVSCFTFGKDHHVNREQFVQQLERIRRDVLGFRDQVKSLPIDERIQKVREEIARYSKPIDQERHPDVVVKLSDGRRLEFNGFNFWPLIAVPEIKTIQIPTNFNFDFSLLSELNVQDLIVAEGLFLDQSGQIAYEVGKMPDGKQPRINLRDAQLEIARAKKAVQAKGSIVQERRKIIDQAGFSKVFPKGHANDYVHLQFENSAGLNYNPSFTVEQSAKLSKLRGASSLQFQKEAAVTDEHLESICELTNLRTLMIVTDLLSEDALDHMRRLPMLGGLYMSGSGRLDETKLLELPVFEQLVELHVQNTTEPCRDWITDKTLEAVTQHPRLKSLALSGTAITNRGLLLLGEDSKLEYLSVANTKIDDDGLENLHNIASFERFAAYSTRITDDGLEDLAKIKTLKKLDLRFNQRITAQGVQKLKTKLPDCEVRWGSE